MRRMYSVSELKTYIEQVLKSGSVDIIANKLTQKIPNWELDIKSKLNSNFFKDTSKLYAKMVLLGNELSLVISGEFVAKADTNNYHALLSSQDVDMPDEVASKIFRADGTSLAEAKSESETFSAYVSSFPCVKANTAVAVATALLNSYSAKNIGLTIYNFGATTEDAVCYIDVRLQLVII